MKPESRLEIARRHVAEAEAAVESQARLVEELRTARSPVQNAISVLAMFRGTLKNYREALALMESEAP